MRAIREAISIVFPFVCLDSKLIGLEWKSKLIFDTHIFLSHTRVSLEFFFYCIISFVMMITHLRYNLRQTSVLAHHSWTIFILKYWTAKMLLMDTFWVIYCLAQFVCVVEQKREENAARHRWIPIMWCGDCKAKHSKHTHSQVIGFS